MLQPLPAVTFNAVGAMPRDRRQLGNQCLRAASQRGVLLIGVECDDLVPEDVLDPAEWWWKHRSPAHLDGCFIAGRRDRTEGRNAIWLPGAPASSVNAPRPILRVQITVDHDWTFTAGALHMPKPRGGAAAGRQMVAHARGSGIDLIGGDMNLRRDAVRSRYPGRTIRSTEVMHLIARDSLTLSAGRPFDLVRGTTADDHPGLLANVRPRGAHHR